MQEQRKSVRMQITGRVQGVTFRWWTQKQTRALGLTGWVRNERDGSVMALICGGAGAVDEMVKRFAAGPSQAIVTGVIVEDADIDGTPEDFLIKGYD